MPGNWTSIETHFPTFTGKEPVTEQLAALQNYLYMLTEQLKYNLSNLDVNNWNEKALAQFSKSATSDLKAAVEAMARHVLQMKEGMTQLSNRLTSLGDSVAEDREQLVKQQEALTYLEAAVKTVKEALQYLQLDFQTLDGQVNGSDGLAERMTDAEDAIYYLQLDIQELADSMSGTLDVETRLTAIEEELSYVAGELEALQQITTELALTVQGLEERVDDVETRTEALETAQDGLQDTVDALDAEIYGAGGLDERMENVEGILAGFVKINFYPGGSVTDDLADLEGQIVLLPDTE